MTERERLETRRYLAKRFGWRCWYCGVKLIIDGGHIDHIIPKANGGPDISSNLSLACNFCNMAKSAHPLEDFMSWLEWVRKYSFTPFNMDIESVKQAIRNELGEQNWEPIIYKSPIGN